MQTKAACLINNEICKFTVRKDKVSSNDEIKYIGETEVH